MDRAFHPGDLVQHFKRTMLSPSELAAAPNRYLYEIIGTAEHTETGETLMVYRRLYGEARIYARPFSMFISRVDREKYPEAGQEFRFEKYQG